MTRIRTLDGGRAVAILLVLVDHTSRNTRFQDKAWASLGFLGVDVFFVLSGYIITARLLEEDASNRRFSLANFYKRRAFRILPLVCTYLAVVAALKWILPIRDFHSGEALGSLFFYRNYQIAAHPGGIYTAHFWSLSIEEHFYLLWPAALFFIGKRKALLLAIGGAILSALWRLFDCAHPVHFLPGAIPALRMLRTDERCDGLLVGCALTILLGRAEVREFTHRNFPKEMPLFAALAIFFNLQWTNGYPTLTTYTLIAVALASTLVVEEGLAHKWLNLRPLAWLGTVSYSLYVWQQLFLLHPDGVRPLGSLSVFPYNLFCVFAVASASYYVIERPMVAIGRRYESAQSAKSAGFALPESLLTSPQTDACRE